MAGNTISKERIISSADDAAINKTFQGWANSLKGITDEIERISVATSNLSKTGNSANSLKEITAQSKLAAQNAKALTDQQKALIDVENKVIQQIEKEAKARKADIDATTAQIRAKKEMANALNAEERAKQLSLRTEKLINTEREKSNRLSSEQAKWQKLKAQQNTAEAGSYNQLSAQYQRMVILLNKQGGEYRDNSERVAALTKRSQELYTELTKLDQATGRNQRNVGNYKSAFNGLQFQMQQIAREAPSLAYGPQMFIAAISNNLPMLQDEIAKTRKQNELLRAEGKQATPVWKQMASGLISWQTAAVTLVTIYMLYNKEINKWIANQFRGKKATDDLLESQKRLNEANKEGYKNGQNELVHARLLYDATQSQSMSLEEKRKAIKSLQEMYPNYLGKFSEEEILAGKAGRAYYELANAIMASAKAKAYENVIADNEVKKLDLEKQITDERKNLVSAQKDLDLAKKNFNTIANTGNADALAGAAAQMLFAKSSVDKYKESIDLLQTQVSQLEWQSKDLASQIKPSDLTFNNKLDKKDLEKQYKTKLQLEKENNEKLLAEFKREKELEAQAQEESLDILYGNRDKNALEQIRYDAALASSKQKNEEDVINFQIKQQERLLSYVKKGSVEEADIYTEIAKLKEELESNITDGIISERKRAIQYSKADYNQQLEDEKALSRGILNNAVNHGNELQTERLKQSRQQILDAKGNAAKIDDIQNSLTLGMIEDEKTALQEALKNSNLQVDERQKINDRLIELDAQKADKEFDIAKKNEERKKELRQQAIQYGIQIVNAGFDFTNQLYENELNSAKQRYDMETAAAGDSIEEKIMAERKYEEEVKKIRHRQAVAEKAQSAFNIAMNTAQAIISIWAQVPKFDFGISAGVLTAMVSTLGAAQLATVLAQPVPEYALGTDNAPHTFIAGEEGQELITLESGKQILTPNKPTLFSGKQFIGAEIKPHDETQRWLANYAMSQTYDMIDMSKTNSHLSKIADNTKPTEQRYTNGKGQTVVKKGNKTTTLC